MEERVDFLKRPSPSRKEVRAGTETEAVEQVYWLPLSLERLKSVSCSAPEVGYLISPNHTLEAWKIPGAAALVYVGIPNKLV